ncbi:MAG: SH3 domain-containing protein [Minisyncoccia bacterium]
MKKILFTLVACIGTLFPYAKPVSAQVGPGYVPAPYTPSYYVCLNDPRSFVYVRSAPSKYSSSMGRLGYGAGVAVYRRFVASDGMYWAQINYFGLNAYIRDDYVCVY